VGVDPVTNAAPSQDSETAGLLRVALDCIGTATFILRPEGEIVVANQAATNLLRAGGVLRERDSRLVTGRPEESKALAAAVARVAERQRAELLRLLGRRGNVAVLIAISPVRGQSLVAVRVADLNLQEFHAAGWTREVFGLSPQNAQLAESLISGISLAEFSKLAGITLGATRTRLKKLFLQTDTRSQAALVSVLSRAATLAPVPAVQ
jgi:PAS domain-containing protein